MLRKEHAATFLCTTGTTFLLLCTVHLTFDTELTARHLDWNTFTKQSRLLDTRNCQCEENHEGVGPPAKGYPRPSSSTFHHPPSYSSVASCGELPSWGQKTVRHPRRPWNASWIRKDGIYVSFDSDLEFAVPLDGMTFDIESKLYIFYHSNTPGTLQIKFQLDNFPSRLTPVGGPFHLMGTSSAQPYAARTMAAAAPLRTSKIFIATAAAHGLPATGGGSAHIPTGLDAAATNCHSVSATLPNGDVFVRKFKTVTRSPKVWLVTTVGVQNDLKLLQHFLTYYTQTVGIDPRNMIITIHTAVPSDPRVRHAKQILGMNGIVHVNDWCGIFNTFDKYEIQESLARRFVLQQDWVLNADLDEHHHYPWPFHPAGGANQSDGSGGGGIVRYLSECEDREINVIFGELKDRVNVKGLLSTVNPHTPLADQFDLICSVTKTVVGGSDTKVMARKGYLMAAEGGYHSLYEWKHTYGRNHQTINPHPTTHAVWHYKWTSDVLGKLEVREQQFKAQGIRWWVQSARMRAFLEKNSGLIDVSASALACKNNGDVSMNDAHTLLPSNRQLHLSTNADNADHVNMYTVILMSHSPARRLNQEAILATFANTVQVREVIFLWNSDAKGMPSIPKGTLRPIRVEQQERNSLNNRWMDSLNVQTDAVLMMDDDMMLPVHTLRSVFARWKYEPTRLVGTTARNFNGPSYLYPKHCCTTFPAIRKACSVIPLKRPSWCAFKLPALTSPHTRPPRFTLDAYCDTFKLVLPKGMMFHRKYLAAYSTPENEPLRKYVDEQKGHCDDIAINFVVANMTGLGGVMVADPVFTFLEADDGLYDGSSEASKSARNNLRSECLTWITAFFNGLTPPPFYVESAEFWLRKQQHRAASPAVAANRQYSVLWKSMQQCVSSNGSPPR